MRHALGPLIAAGLAVRAQEIIETRTLPHAVFLTEVPVVSNEGTVGTVIETVYDTMPTATEVQPYPTVTKVITETVTRHRHHHVPDFMASTKTVANIDGDGPVTLTSDMQLVGDHTLIKVMPQAPAATVVPLTWEPSYIIGFEMIIDMDFRTLKEMYPDIDWTDLNRIAHHLRQHNHNIDPVVSIKFALILVLRSRRHTQYGQQRMAGFPPLSQADNHTTARMVDLGTTRFEMTQATQTVGNRVYVDDPLNRFRAYDPVSHAVAPTQGCDVEGKKHNRTACHIQRCMWNNFMKPINVTTVMPMAMYDQHRLVNVDYFTHSTELHYPHWGTTTSEGLYYPTSRSYHVINGTATGDVIRATPAWVIDRSQIVHGRPVCKDLEDCHAFCGDHYQHHDMDFFKHSLWWILMIVLAMLALMLICCLCCCAAFRKRRNNKNDPNRKDSIIPEKLRRKSSTKPEVVVVNPVTGTATDPATGQAVNPALATAAVIGAAAGADAAREKGSNEGGQGGNQNATGGDDGKGTAGRRAEEGRGRVNFEDGGHPGSESAAPPSPTTEVHPAAAPAEHVEAAPAGQHDGTSELSTGRSMPDMGSMRGRKRARPEGQGMKLNLGF